MECVIHFFTHANFHRNKHSFQTLSSFIPTGLTGCQDGGVLTSSSLSSYSNSGNNHQPTTEELIQLQQHQTAAYLQLQNQIQGGGGSEIPSNQTSQQSSSQHVRSVVTGTFHHPLAYNVRNCNLPPFNLLNQEFLSSIFLRAKVSLFNAVLVSLFLILFLLHFVLTFLSIDHHMINVGSQGREREECVKERVRERERERKGRM